MNWNDWEAVWRRQSPPAGAAADLAALQTSFAASSAKMARTLWLRDWLETLAGLFVAGVFSWVAYTGMMKGKVVWPIWLGVLCILGVTAFFVRERLRTRRSRLRSDAPLRAKISADLAELRHQHRLLTTIASWYLAPIALGMALVLATAVYNAAPWSPLRNPRFIGGMGAFMLALFAVAWRANWRIARGRIEPRLIELEKLLRSIEAPEG